MKKCLSIVLSVLLLLMSVPMVAADTVQPEGPYFTASVVEGKPGETIVVEILAKNNPGIVSAKVAVGYDADVLKLVDYAPGDFSAGNFADDGSAASASGYSWGPIANNPFVINWCNSLEQNSTKELLATLTFEILDDAEYGSTAIALIVDCAADVFDYDLVTVAFDVVAGEAYVLYPVVNLSLSYSDLEMTTGDTIALDANPMADGKTDETVVWESSDPSVATVDANGVVTAIKEGTVTITATAVYGNKSATCNIAVACGHSNTTKVPAKDSTCTANGNEAYTVCNDCGRVIDGSDAKLPLAKHNYESKVTKQPTCTDAGVRTYTCSACGDTYTEAIAAIGHDYKTAVTAPTCTEAGYTTYTCACGDNYKSDYVAALGHDYKAVVTAPDCENGGYTTYTCACGDTYKADYMDALGHKEEIIPGKAATCTATGLTDGAKCSVCGEALKAQETIPATGEHTYDNDKDADCNVCGEKREVQTSTPGDINDDGKINNRDLGILQQFLNEWDVTINEDAADVNDDGKINNRDQGLLQQYLNEWDVVLK